MYKYLILFLLPLSLYASPELNQVQCSSFDQAIIISINKMSCQDSRYQIWEKNGCYLLETEINGQRRQIEMVRNLRFELEEQQGFYSMYTYDQNEWILEGFIVEFEADGDHPHPRMRFDYRDRHPQKFTSIFGYCQVLN